MAHGVFVSYSTRDRTVANAVVARLEEDGFRCWVAPRDILPGTTWGEAIVGAIQASRVMVLILSRDSNSSRQVLLEVERAVASDVIILPFRIEDVDPTGAMAYYLGSEHWLDALTPPLERHIERLSVTVGRLLSQGPPPPPGEPGRGPEASARKRLRPWVPLVLGALVVAVGAVLAGILLGRGEGESAEVTDGAGATTVGPGSSSAAGESGTAPGATPVTLVEVGRLEPVDLDPGDGQPPGLVNGFAIDGSTLAFAGGVDGVTRVAIGDASQPRHMATYGVADAQAVAFVDGYLCAVAGDPAKPQEVVVFPVDGSGGVNLPWTEPLTDVTAAGRAVYVSGWDYVGVLDAADPNAPELVFEWTSPGTTGSPVDVFISEGVGFFAAGWDGLYTYDLTDPASPAGLGHWASPDWVISVVVSDGLAYATLGNSGLAVVDVSDPGNPVMLGRTEVPGFASQVDVAFGHAFVGWTGQDYATGGIAVVDVGDPPNPAVVGTSGQLPITTGVQVVGTHLFVTEETQGLFVFEITGVG